MKMIGQGTFDHLCEAAVEYYRKRKNWQKGKQRARAKARKRGELVDEHTTAGVAADTTAGAAADTTDDVTTDTIDKPTADTEVTDLTSIPLWEVEPEYADAPDHTARAVASAKAAAGRAAAKAADALRRQRLEVQKEQKRMQALESAPWRARPKKMPRS